MINSSIRVFIALLIITIIGAFVKSNYQSVKGEIEAYYPRYIKVLSVVFFMLFFSLLVALSIDIFRNSLSSFDSDSAKGLILFGVISLSAFLYCLIVFKNRISIQDDIITIYRFYGKKEVNYNNILFVSSSSGGFSGKTNYAIHLSKTKFYMISGFMNGSEVVINHLKENGVESQKTS